MAGLGWNKYAYGGKGGKDYKGREQIRYCKICGKQATKGKYCQTCYVFLNKMQKRDQLAH